MNNNSTAFINHLLIRY